MQVGTKITIKPQETKFPQNGLYWLMFRYPNNRINAHSLLAWQKEDGSIKYLTGVPGNFEDLKERSLNKSITSREKLTELISRFSGFIDIAFQNASSLVTSGNKRISFDLAKLLGLSKFSIYKPLTVLDKELKPERWEGMLNKQATPIKIGSDDEINELFNQLQEFARQVNDAELPFNMISNCCHSFVGSVLRSLDLSEIQPPSQKALGWKTRLEDRIPKT